MAREHKKCLNPYCLGKEEGRTGNKGGTYLPEKKTCDLCNAPYNKRRYKIWKVFQTLKNSFKRNNVTTNMKGMVSIMLEKITTIIGIIIFILASILSFTWLPIFLGGLAVLCFIGSFIAIIGLIFNLIPDKLTKHWMTITKKTFICTGIGFFVLAFLIWGGMLLFQSFANKQETAAYVDQTAAEEVAEIESTTEAFSLGVPADIDTVNQSVWDQEMDKAVMVDGNGTTIYTQSGKDDSVLLKGQIPEGQALVLDSYSVSFTDENGVLQSYSLGNLIVKIGPFDLDANPISYTDGAAQIIGVISLQKFLDENIWLKFSRGNRLSDNSAWSYQHWALSNFWLPDGYTFKELGLTAETDTYPNK